MELDIALPNYHRGNAKRECYKSRNWGKCDRTFTAAEIIITDLPDRLQPYVMLLWHPERDHVLTKQHYHLSQYSRRVRVYLIQVLFTQLTAPLSIPMCNCASLFILFIAAEKT